MKTKQVFHSDCLLGVKVQCWTWRPNLHVVQIFVGNVEVRIWRMARSADAEAKFKHVCQAVTDNERITLV